MTMSMVVLTSETRWIVAVPSTSPVGDTIGCSPRRDTVGDDGEATAADGLPSLGWHPASTRPISSQNATGAIRTTDLRPGNHEHCVI